MKTVSENSASAAELETPNSLDEALETGFLPDDPHYRLTGEFKSEEKEASAASTKEKPAADETESGKETENENESENSDASAASSSKAAASETAPTQKEGQRESRWAKRERELKEARAEIARLKTQGTQPQTRSESSQASQPAADAKSKPAPKPAIDDVDAKGQPKYKTYADYEAAKDEWNQGEALRKFREENTQSEQQRQLQHAERVLAEGMVKKFEAARTKYADFDEVALNKDLVIPRGSVADAFLLDSDHAGEVAYYLGQHPEILKGFYSDYDLKTGKFTNVISQQRQFRRLMEIEREVAGDGKEGTEGRPASAKPVTQAPRPAHQVSGKGTVSKDSVEQAVEEGDAETYIREQNARDLARRKQRK